MRGFQWISQYEHLNMELPVRKTQLSAGYDLALVEDIALAPGTTTLLPTGLKAFMEEDEVLLITIRSGKAFKDNLRLANGVGVIDGDYYNNPDNEGHILLAVHNMNKVPLNLKAGEAIAQGIFLKYLRVSEDSQDTKRKGGFGSTDSFSKT